MELLFDEIAHQLRRDDPQRTSLPTQPETLESFAPGPQPRAGLHLEGTYGGSDGWNPDPPQGSRGMKVQVPHPIS